MITFKLSYTDEKMILYSTVDYHQGVSWSAINPEVILVSFQTRYILFHLISKSG